MRIDDYAERMGISTTTARRWFHAGKIPGAFKRGGRIMVPEAGTEVFIPSTDANTICQDILDRIGDFDALWAEMMDKYEAMHRGQQTLNSRLTEILKIVKETK